MNGWLEILQVVIGGLAVVILLIGFGNSVVGRRHQSAADDAAQASTKIADIADQHVRVHRTGDEAAEAACYAMALAAHDPSFSPSAPVSAFDAGGPAGFGM